MQHELSVLNARRFLYGGHKLLVHLCCSIFPLVCEVCDLAMVVLWCFYCLVVVLYCFYLLLSS